MNPLHSPRRSRRLATLLAAWLVSLTALAEAPALRVDAAWARATAPGAANGAAYFTLTGGDVDDRLLAAGAAVSERVELHTHALHDGMMRMTAVHAVEVPAAARVEFRPGGYHVMLLGLRAPLVAGSRFPLRLTFARGGVVDVEVEVRAADVAPGGHRHSHGSH
jgi:copper(I)-binding protein